MKSILKLTTVTLILILFNCKNKTVQIEYHYSDKPVAVTCNDLNTKLYHEALYSFENDILNFYGKNRGNTNATPNLTMAYNQFVRNAISGRVPYQSIVSTHTKRVFEALKQDKTLWDSENTKSHLNYSSPLIDCIANNINDNNLKTTFNALLSINDLSPKLFGAPLTSKYRNALNDKYLASYIAFDLYYSRLFDVDLSMVNLETLETNVDFNNIPSQNDPHAGHNH
ncbi:hypothetical protein [Seonamhaeicola aphaedonensis]|uniref:Uncharacterized protein n=1 Tax=Seonamhaeicola aphaedonensis TaxID=1461338 RepID=A0A3D9HDI2_9FLAO|nr:hypothetical protein [Seonamhaeicola aphaedonensis]RED47542.1 hypothetical protein DFQ02_106170 [Seonamhaeicola aphaedonensis]